MKTITIIAIILAGTCGIASGQVRSRPAGVPGTHENGQGKTWNQVEAEQRKKAFDAVKLKNEQAAAAQNVADGSDKAVAARKSANEKALKWNQEEAAKGNAYGLLRMGERYRDGDGVPKDLTKARESFTKAKDAGSVDAAAALAKLNQPSTNAPAGKVPRA